MYETDELRWRLYALMAIVAAFVLVLTAKLFYIQVLQNSYYTSLAKKEHWREETILPRRGSILDTNGSALATSVSFESLYANTSQITNADRLAKAIAGVLNEPANEVEAKLLVQQAAPVLVKPFLSWDTAEALRRLRLWDVFLEPEFKRYYPEGSLAASLMGLVGRDNKGLTGVEAALDPDLAGMPGSVLAERDSGGDEIALSARQITPPKDGSDVVVTIDRFVQRVIERELNSAVRLHQAAGGVIVVMEPRTGAILGMANRPTFDLNDPNLFHPTRAPLYRNPAIADAWEPGSIFKIVTMAAALDAKAVTPDEAFNNTGRFAYGGGTVRNVITRLGPETMTQVLQRSSNIGAAYAGTKLGADRFYQYVTMFGFGQPTEVEVPGESGGILRKPGMPSWYPFDLAANSFGQGIAVTPLQMVTAASAVANGGILMKPYVIKEVMSPQRRVYNPTVIRQVISPETARTLTGMLVSVVETTDGGVVRMSKVPGYALAGKTGTAEIPGREGYTSGDTIASFLGFGPAEDPRFVILVKIDSPKASPWGETVAAPTFKKVAEQLLAHMRVPRQETR
ncbi:MAG: penicillin-binding protein 2 [Chloroflexi bacterium]|nr:penicillin-binding protein 2 [Chloroflexota bacterium]